MSQQDIIRAWKDKEFRNSLNEEQRSQLPENPAGILDMSDESLETIFGGARTGAGTGGNCCTIGDPPDPIHSGDGTMRHCCICK
ncbi:MAG: mersacidin/lichenicidin family type 2 lantibiotic [Pleurocapsa sp. MO_192.B19]|nr:mersacidin/lichenicidin family type 2 lantibiotic [Pleurocapsa sp. MO_192.B19]